MVPVALTHSKDWRALQQDTESQQKTNGKFNRRRSSKSMSLVEVGNPRDKPILLYNRTGINLMITSRIYDWARRQSTKPAIVANDLVFNYAEFACAIEAVRSFLERQNLPVNRTAVILPSNLLDAWVFTLALRALGLNTICVQSVDQTDTLNLRNVVVVVLSEFQREGPKLEGSSLAGIEAIIVPRAIVSNQRSADPPPHPIYSPPFGGHILLTSGTTGIYKKLFVDGRDEDKRNAARASVLSLDDSVVYHVASLGPWTATGFRMPLAVWHQGGCIVIDSRRDAFENFFRHPVTLTILTPEMLKLLVHSYRQQSRRDECEAFLTSGFLPVDLAEQTVRCVTKRLGIGYGSTELAIPALMSRGGLDDDIYWLSPPANRVLRVTDEYGRECPPGQEGELSVKLIDIDCKSYLDDEDTTARMFREGFFWPGDMAIRRADGRVRILGRTGEVLNIQGNKVPVAPLEQALQTMLRVEEVCLFSGLSNAGKVELMVAIQTKEPLPRAELERIPHEFPSFEHFRFVFLKEFPRTTAGTRKTKRSVLRKLFDQRVG